MKRLAPRALVLCQLGCCASLFVAASARAAIPADYKGTPFDPAKAGGVGIIPTTVKAGPYPIPGRLDFVNYDLGGELVAYHAGDHITNKNGAGYRTDAPTATLSLTAQSKPDIWYGTGTTTDGGFYPSSASADFYIGAVQVNDWFNFTVDVKTAGMYTLSSTWASGNGPPGGEGGDGAMGLQVFVNGNKELDWKDTFPNFNTSANFHNWKPYPSLGTITLEAGPQLIKLQSTSKHLNLDYVEFALVGGDTSTGGAAGSSAAGSAGVSSGGDGSGGSAGTSAAAGSPNTTAGSPGAGGASSAASAGTSSESAGSPASSGAGPTTAAPSANNDSGCSCSLPASEHSTQNRSLALTLLAGLALLTRARRRVQRPLG